MGPLLHTTTIFVSGSPLQNLSYCLVSFSIWIDRSPIICRGLSTIDYPWRLGNAVSAAFRLLHSLDGFFRAPSISETVCVSDRLSDSSEHHPRITHIRQPHSCWLILSSFCRHYINPLCSGCLASGMRWTECMGSIQLVLKCTLPLDLDWVYPLSGWCSITSPVSLIP